MNDTGTTQGTRLAGLWAEFDTPVAILAAAAKVREAGYRWWDCQVPFAVHGLDRAMGVSRTILPVLVFFGGLTGTLLAISLQVFTNSMDLEIWAIASVSGYPFVVSGKPLLSGPAFVPVMFELTVLLASFTAFGGMFMLNGLPRLHHPVLSHPRLARATDDRFFIVIESRDPRFIREETEAFLEGLDPLAVGELED